MHGAKKDVFSIAWISTLQFGGGDFTKDTRMKDQFALVLLLVINILVNNERR